METNEITEIRREDDGLHTAVKVNTSKLDSITGDGVNLQCINSSDFMVGKQTNFNGTVTIINCSEENNLQDYLNKRLEKEEVVIKDRVFTPVMSMTMEDYVNKKVEKELFNFYSLNKNEHKVKQICMKNVLKIPIFGWFLLLIFILLGCVTVILELTSNDDGSEIDGYIKINGNKFRFVRRTEWNALPAKTVRKLIPPLRYVVIAHSAGAYCYYEDKCHSLVHNMQIFNMNERNLSDIKYNFLVSGNGIIYEGRGWNVENENNDQNVDFCFIGDFTKNPPTAVQVEGVRALVDFALQNKYIAKDYYLLPASAVMATKSPGEFVISEIKQWPRYRPTLPD